MPLPDTGLIAPWETISRGHPPSDGFSYHLREISNFKIAVSPRNGSARNWPSIWFTFVAKVPHQGFPEWLQAPDLCIHRPRLTLASSFEQATPGQLDSSSLQSSSTVLPEVFSFDATMGLVSYFSLALTSRHLVWIVVALLRGNL